MLTRYSEDDTNPRLETLRDIIIDHRDDIDAPPRVIVFCMTRELARSLCRWMTRDPELGPLKPDCIVGGKRSHSDTDRAGSC